MTGISLGAMLGLERLFSGLSSLVQFDTKPLSGMAFTVLIFSLGFSAPRGFPGSILGSTIGFILINGVLNDPEYGPEGHIAYSVGFFLIVTVVIGISAALRLIARKFSSRRQ